MKLLRHILCVDDEEDIQEIVKLCLELDGDFTITCCGSGAEALESLPSTKPDLILLDVMMPRMDGPATFSAIKNADAGRNLPVIFMTARIQGPEVSQYLAMGAIGVVPKPFDPMTLADEIRRLWAKAQEKAEVTHAGSAM
jgi:two-component system, OmpR family, response regulator